MKILILLLLLHAPTKAYLAEEKNGFIEVVAINSPVKESALKISISGPAGFEITSAKYLIKDAISLVDKSKKDTPLEITKSGDTYSASIVVNMLPPGQYRMYLKVKDKIKNHEVDVRSSRKHVFKEYLNFVIESSVEVKDPGEEGKKTLAGIDSDNDGIRDDVQLYINANSEGEVQLAYKQHARLTHLRIINHADTKLSETYDQQLNSAMNCLFALNDNASLIPKIGAIITNTEMRAKHAGSLFTTFNRLQPMLSLVEEKTRIQIKKMNLSEAELSSPKWKDQRYRFCEF